MASYRIGYVLSIVGPGGVGGVLAAVAQRAGEDVEVVATPQTARVLNERGLHLKSRQFGEFHTDIVARTEPSANSLIIVAVKSYSIPEIADVVRDSKPKEVLALCNGLAHAEAIHALGAPRATSGSIRIVSERIESGRYLHHSQFTIIGMAEAARDWGITAILDRIGIATNIGGTERQVLWNKLRFLAPMALLTASKATTLGPAREGSEDLLAEIAAIATAEGVETTPGDIADNLARIDGNFDSSLGRDVTAGNRTELDALGTDLIRIARTHGIATPALEEAVATIERRLRS